MSRNTSAYDALSSLRLLDGLVDVYMPDFKFWSPDTALRLARARDYPDRAREAILEMHRQVGPLKLGPDGLARRGVLVRHLVMPGQEDEAAAIFEWLAREVSPYTYVNVMGQYRPQYQVGRLPGDLLDVLLVQLALLERVAEFELAVLRQCGQPEGEDHGRHQRALHIVLLCPFRLLGQAPPGLCSVHRNRW